MDVHLLTSLARPFMNPKAWELLGQIQFNLNALRDREAATRGKINTIFMRLDIPCRASHPNSYAHFFDEMEHCRKPYQDLKDFIINHRPELLPKLPPLPVGIIDPKDQENNAEAIRGLFLELVGPGIDSARGCLHRGIEFVPGGYKIKGELFDLPGKPLEVLKYLAMARDGRRSVSEILDDLWEEDEKPEQSTVTSHVCIARKSLKTALKQVKIKLPAKTDPIKNINKSTGKTAWELIDLSEF